MQNSNLLVIAESSSLRKALEIILISLQPKTHS